MCPVDCIYEDGGGYGGGGGFDDPESFFDPGDFWAIINAWMDVPYLDNGATAQGADCSHLIWLIYNDMGLNYEYCSTSYFANSPHWVQVDSPSPGDILVWPGHHSMIYYPHSEGGNNYDGFSSLVHANNGGSGWAYIWWFSGSYGTHQYYRYKP